MTEPTMSEKTKPFLYLAPIRGVTDSFFRTTFADIFGGFDAAVAPFFRVDKGEFNPGILKDLKPKKNKKLPVVPQILTRKPDVLVAAANACAQMGYEEINWNLGCPHRQVTKKGLGAGLLTQPQTVDDVLKAAFEESKIKISVKVRLGLDDPDQLQSLLPALNNHPLDKIIIHPRTASQMYDGVVHLDEFESCLNTADHPVVYNGDICTLQDFENLQIRFPKVTSWMIGRGALANPFLATSIRDDECLDEKKQLKKLSNFHRLLYKHYGKKLNGDAHLLAKMRSIWEYMTQSVPNGKKFAKKIKRAKSVGAYEFYIKEFLSEAHQ